MASAAIQPPSSFLMGRSLQCRSVRYYYSPKPNGRMKLHVALNCSCFCQSPLQDLGTPSGLRLASARVFSPRYGNGKGTFQWPVKVRQSFPGHLVRSMLAGGLDAGPFPGWGDVSFKEGRVGNGWLNNQTLPLHKINSKEAGKIKFA